MAHLWNLSIKHKVLLLVYFKEGIEGFDEGTCKLLGYKKKQMTRIIAHITWKTRRAIKKRGITPYDL